MTATTNNGMRSIDQMIQQEVLCCMSSLVSTLANGHGQLENGARMRESYKTAPGADLSDLCEQASELACPIDDYEEPLVEEGWTHDARGWHHPEDLGAEGHAYAHAACDEAGLEPYQREVFEHWAVTDWFAEKLEAAGEKVDKDFGGLCIWARTTTGQAIYADSVIERIYAATHSA